MSKRCQKIGKRSSIFRKFLGFLILSCMLTAVLSACIICITSAGAFAQRIAQEMVPRVHSISRIASRYQTGQISYDSFLDIAIREQQGAEIYVIDGNGILQISTPQTNGSTPSFDETLASHALEVLQSGEPRIWIDWQAADGIVVGAPVTDNMQRVSGAILMTRQTSHVFRSMSGLLLIIVGSCLLASVIVILPAYFASKHISKPIQQMTQISMLMASGDFSARADESNYNEIGQLGSALNYLSGQLNRNIQDLTLARNRLHVILEGLHEGVIALDSASHITYCNQAALTMFSCRDSDALGRCLPDIRSLCASVIATHAPQQYMTAYGERKLLLIIGYSQETSEIEPGTIVVIQDVTASERLEETRRDYVANVSHELRTPISSIRSLAETLNDGMVTSEEDKNRYYGYILRESMRLSRLINDLLELSRLQSGAVALEKSDFDLAVLLREVSERMSVVAGYSGIRVVCDIEECVSLPAFSNRDRIEQTLVSLLDNAIKFAVDDGEIHISICEETQRYLISVANTGYIQPNDLPHLFERFYKADTAHTDSHGTGLGLAITQEVLNLLGEEICAENEDGMAVFRFTVAKDG